VGSADKAFLTGIDNTQTPYLADQCYAGKKRGMRFMTPPEKSKNKRRPYPLRRVLLVMVIGVAFMFWMPFVIITRESYIIIFKWNLFHWLNYVIYWGAALVWLVPLVIWLKRHVHLPRLHRLRTILLLIMVWLFLMSGGWFITKRVLLPPIHDDDLSCYANEDSDPVWYRCNVRIVPYTSTASKSDACENRRFAPECYVVSGYVVAEGQLDFPLAQTIAVRTDIEFVPDWYRRTNCCGVGDG
jgi:hypothetical protein